MKRPTRDRHRKPPSKSSQASATLSPLQYMRMVLNDPTASKSRRDRMAVTLARYLYRRPSDYRPKKDRQAEAAKKAGVGSEWDTDLEFSGGRSRE